MSLVVYGGTFDPLHLAHLRLAWEALEELGARQLSFLPSAAPPHRELPGATAKQRADWIARAIEDVPGFGLDRRELARSGPSWSVLTLRELRTELGPAVPLVWLIGEDALSGLAQWHCADELWQHAHFAVLRRPDLADRAVLQARYAERRVPASELMHSASGRIAWLANTELAYSASAIRQRLRRGQSLRYLVDDRIRADIESSAAYQQRAT